MVCDEPKLNQLTTTVINSKLFIKFSPTGLNNLRQETNKNLINK